VAKLMPPLTIPKDQLAEGLEIVAASVDDVLR
jgi:4-aminobutyrate aminotransferase-like enzyme